MEEVDTDHRILLLIVVFVSSFILFLLKRGYVVVCCCRWVFLKIKQNGDYYDVPKPAEGIVHGRKVNTVRGLISLLQLSECGRYAASVLRLHSDLHPYLYVFDLTTKEFWRYNLFGKYFNPLTFTWLESNLIVTGIYEKDSINRFFVLMDHRNRTAEIKHKQVFSSFLFQHTYHSMSFIQQDPNLQAVYVKYIRLQNKYYLPIFCECKVRHVILLASDISTNEKIEISLVDALAPYNRGGDVQSLMSNFNKIPIIKNTQLFYFEQYQQLTRQFYLNEPWTINLTIILQNLRRQGNGMNPLNRCSLKSDDLQGPLDTFQLQLSTTPIVDSIYPVFCTPKFATGSECVLVLIDLEKGRFYRHPAKITKGDVAFFYPQGIMLLATHDILGRMTWKNNNERIPSGNKMRSLKAHCQEIIVNNFVTCPIANHDLRILMKRS